MYSPFILSALLGVPSIYEIYISVNLGGPPIGITASFGSLGQTGNDPVTGNYYVAQDNSNGLGFVTVLNNAISGSAVPGGTNSLQFKNNPIFSILNGTGYDSSGFNGVSLEIKTTDIETVTITDNSTALSNSVFPSVPIAPFLGNYLNPQGSTETCTGMFSASLSNLPPNYNDLVFGGSI